MVSFELGEEIQKHIFFVLSQAWEKENFWVPARNWTSDVRIPRSDAQPETLWLARPIKKFIYDTRSADF